MAKEVIAPVAVPTALQQAMKHSLARDNSYKHYLELAFYESEQIAGSDFPIKAEIMALDLMSGLLHMEQQWQKYWILRECVWVQSDNLALDTTET